MEWVFANGALAISNRQGQGRARLGDSETVQWFSFTNTMFEQSIVDLTTPFNGSITRAFTGHSMTSEEQDGPRAPRGQRTSQHPGNKTRGSRVAAVLVYLRPQNGLLH